MKEFKDSIQLDLPLKDAFHVLFDDTHMLEYMHQKVGFKTDGWSGDKRVVHFELPHENIPQAVVNLIGGGQIRATTYQEKKESSDRIEVKNKIKAHVLGAEFIKIRPQFTLKAVSDNQTLFEIQCKLCAIMPPPFNKIIEGFMFTSSKTNFVWFKEAVAYALAKAREKGSK